MKTVDIYVHSDKDSNYDKAESLGITDAEAIRNFVYTGMEERLTYSVNVKTGESKLIGANGFYLSDEEII